MGLSCKKRCIVCWATAIKKGAARSPAIRPIRRRGKRALSLHRQPQGLVGCLPAEMLRTLGLSPEDQMAGRRATALASEIAFLKEMPTVLIAPN